MPTPSDLRAAVEEVLRVFDLGKSPVWTAQYAERALRAALASQPEAPARTTSAEGGHTEVEPGRPDAERGGLAPDRDAMIDVPASQPEGAAPSLDAAWREAEAALPEGHHICAVEHIDGDERTEWRAETYDSADHSGGQAATGFGPTPDAALQALAARLTREDRSPGDPA